MLSGFTFCGIAAEEVSESGKDLGFGCVLKMELRKPLPMEASAEVKIVFSGRPARQGDLGDVWPGAAIGTAAHPQGNRFFRQAVLGQKQFKLADQAGQISFAFRHG